MKAHFARHGIPDKPMSDNGPQYTSEEFQKFTETWGIEHDTSSPLYLESNGFAKKTSRLLNI